MKCDKPETPTMRLMRCTHQFVMAWHNMPPPVALSGRQFYTLITIRFMSKDKENGVTVSELAKKVGVSNAAVSQNVTALVDEGMLERVQDKKDRRVIYLHVTEKGLKTTHDAFGKMLELMQDATQGIDADALSTQLVEYTDIIKTVTANINKGDN